MSGWTMDMVFVRVIDARRTLRLLPPAHPRSKCTYWPDFVRDYHQAHDPERPDENGDLPGRRPHISPRQLTELDEVIAWLAWLQPLDQDLPRILWARACGLPWRKIAARTRPNPVSHTTAKYRFRQAVALVMFALRDGELKGDPRGGPR